jgi:hypothetical protein
MSDFTEAFLHLLLMAFLQRVTNGEGRIERERIDPTAPCYLVIFDRRLDKLEWVKRLKWINNTDVTIVGC